MAFNLSWFVLEVVDIVASEFSVGQEKSATHLHNEYAWIC